MGNKHTGRLAAGILVGTMSLTMLTGCEQKLNGTKKAATADGETITLGQVSLLARYRQVKMGSMYSSMMGFDAANFWDGIQDEKTGETYGESTVKDAARQLQELYVVRAKAPEYGVELTKEEEREVKDAAAEFLKENSPEVLERIGASREDIETFLELSAYRNKIREKIILDVDKTVADEEAQQSAVTYTKVAVDADADDAAKDAAKAAAQEILDAVLATANADLKEIAQSIREDSQTVNTHYSTNEEDATIPAELKSAAEGLADGEVASELIAGDNCWYILRLEKHFDKEATEAEKDVIITKREQELYDETAEGWFEAAAFTVDEDVLKEVKISSKQVYTEKKSKTDA